MPSQLAKSFHNLIYSIKIDFQEPFTEVAYKRFEVGQDILMTYRGHPDTLMQALQVFATTTNRAYFLAGAALVLHHASYLSGDESDAWGEKEAQKLFNQSLSLGRGRFEIAQLEVTFFKSLTERRRILDTLARKYPEAQTNIRFALSELSYFYKARNVKQAEQWFKVSLERAENNIQRLYALNIVAGMHLSIGKGESAIPYYQQVVALDPNDPWAWHNLSCVYMRLKNYEQAGVCNRRALDVMPFGAATAILKSLIEQWEPHRHEDPLAEVARYLMN